VTDDGPQPGGDGWLLHAGRLREDLFSLVTIMVAARDFEWAADLFGLAELRREFEQEAIDHALITIAIRVRVLMDQTPSLTSANAPCGTLDVDVATDNPRELSLRQACNKIIHA